VNAYYRDRFHHDPQSGRWEHYRETYDRDRVLIGSEPMGDAEQPVLYMARVGRGRWWFRLYERVRDWRYRVRPARGWVEIGALDLSDDDDQEPS